MNKFIKKQEYNYIKRCMGDLNSALRNCVDKNVVDAVRICCQDKILSHFNDLSDEQKKVLDISNITDPLLIEPYLKELNQYVYGMSKLSSAEVIKVFKKEKKLKLPNLDIEDSKLVYLGWIDESTRKLLIVYKLDGKLLGMACRLPKTSNKGTNICALCNHIGSESEVAFVSPICKQTSEDDYKSLGFYVCLDSNKCNERIESAEKLEELITTVNRIR